MKILAENKKAKFDYDIKETYTAGMVLTGAEVKAAKTGNVSLAGSYVTINQAKAQLINCHIGPYKYARQENYNPTQSRGLLLNKQEINQLVGKEKGTVLIPLSVFLGRGGRLKLSIGLGRARKKTDKREYIKERDTKREIRNSY